MARIPGLRRDFRFPWRTRQQIDRDVDDELGFHLEMRTGELVREGLSADQAERQARGELGDLARARRDLSALGRRSERRNRLLVVAEELRQDVRYGLRSLGNNAGFTAVAMLVLALGIGANTAVFSVINVMLLRPRNIVQPERMVGVYGQSTEDPTDFDGFSYPTYTDLREQSRTFEQLVAHDIAMVGVAEDGTTRRAMAGLVSSNYFGTFGVPLLQGRAFTREEEQPGAAAHAVVVSYAFWERRGADPDLVGKTLLVNGQPMPVVGITRPGFTGTTVLVSPDFWLPLGAYSSAIIDTTGGRSADLSDRRNRSLMLFGRLRAGVAMETAESELRSMAAQLEAQYPAAQERQSVRLARLPRLSISTDPDTGEESGILTGPSVLLMGMAGVVLLIACLNLANMLIARGASRRTEMAIRVSLGGGRGRLLRQLLTEGLVLAVLGGGAGLLLAYWASRLLVGSLANLLPFGTLVANVGPDLRVLVATFLFCLLATLFFALGPALEATRVDVLGGLKDESAGMGRRRGATWRAPRNLLVVGQIALSLVLLTAGGLFVRGALAAGEADPGFSLEERILVEIDPSLVGYDEQRGREILDGLRERLEALPGVEAVSQSSIVPFGPRRASSRVERPGALPGGGDGRDSQGITAYHYRVGSGYFRTLGLPILRGRDFTPDEAAGPALEPGAERAAVVIVDRPLVEQLFGDEDPLGRQIVLPGSSPGREDRTLEVVGVVPGTRHDITDRVPKPHVYLPFAQDYSPNAHLYLHVPGGGEAGAIAMLPVVRDAIRAYDDQLPVLSVTTLLQHRAASLSLWLVVAGAKVFSLFAGLALLLAVVGVYGVKAYVVSRRTREIGIRTALGAQRRDLIWLMVKEGLVLTGLGLGIGVALSLAVGQLLSSLLYEVSATDPLVLLLAPLVLAAAALLAAYLPARRATRIAPTVALRYE